MRMTKEEKQVYDKLMDDISKVIFYNRKKFNETKDYSYIVDMVKNCTSLDLAENPYYPGKEQELIKKLLLENRDVVIFGSGIKGRRFLKLLENTEVNVKCFIDNDFKKVGTTIGGIKINSLNELSEEIRKNCIFVITPRQGIETIYGQLMSKGINANNVYVLRDYSPTRDGLMAQYFDSDIVKVSNEEVFIDGGCFDLETSLLFEEFCRKNNVKTSKVIAFEPDKNNYKKCVEKLDDLKVKNIKLINRGLWSSDGEIGFSENLGSSSHVGGENMIYTTALDSLALDKITFIKMDIEGAELEALHGGEKTILRDKPKLAISVYHKPEDIVTIPMYVKSLVPEYKIYFRHYSNTKEETVMYAVCD